MIFYVVYNILYFFGKPYNDSTHHTTISWIGLSYNRNMHGEMLAFFIDKLVIFMEWFDYSAASKRGEPSPFGSKPS